MTTTVVNIRGKSPDEWQADPGHIYVGGRYRIKTGQHAGQLWRPTLFFSPVRLRSEEPTRSERVAHVLEYLDWLDEERQRKRLLPSLQLIRGKRLGCWDGAWDGEKRPCYLLCPASVLAILADHWQPGMDRRELVREWMALEIKRGAACV